MLERLDDHTGLYSPEAVIRQSAEFGRLHIQRFGAGMAGPTLHMRVTLLGGFSRATNEALDEVLKMTQETNVIVYCDSPGEVDRMNELIRQHSGTSGQGLRTAGENRPRSVRARGAWCHLQVCWGWCIGASSGRANLAIVPHHELFGRAEPRRLLRRVRAGRPIESFLDL